MRVMFSDCSSHSLAAKRIAIASLYWIRNGATSIDSSIDARITCVSTGSTRPSPSIWFSSTKPNSPACASPRPVRIATPGREPNSRASPAISTNLNSTGTISSVSTSHRLSITTRTLSSMPMVTKNSPSSTSRNGLMSSST